MYDVLVKNGKLVTPDRIYEADIAIQDGKYAGFFAKGAPVDAKEVIDAKGNYVFPGIIDCHAHLNEPGFEYRANVAGAGGDVGPEPVCEEMRLPAP